MGKMPCMLNVCFPVKKHGFGNFVWEQKAEGSWIQAEMGKKKKLGVLQGGI